MPDPIRIFAAGGTFDMKQTAAALGRGLAAKTILLTGAMVPYPFGSADGLFNLGPPSPSSGALLPACTS